MASALTGWTPMAMNGSLGMKMLVTVASLKSFKAIVTASRHIFVAVCPKR